MLLQQHSDDYTNHNNKWDFKGVRTSLDLCARVAKSPIYFCENVRNIS